MQPLTERTKAALREALEWAMEDEAPDIGLEPDFLTEYYRGHPQIRPIWRCHVRRSEDIRFGGTSIGHTRLQAIQAALREARKQVEE